MTTLTAAPRFPARTVDGDTLNGMKNWYLKLSNPVKAAINTAWQSFLGAFGLSLLGWLDDVKEWASDRSLDFPSVSPLGKAFAAAAVAAGSFLVTVVVRGVQASRNPMAGPKYPTTTP